MAAALLNRQDFARLLQNRLIEADEDRPLEYHSSEYTLSRRGEADGAVPLEPFHQMYLAAPQDLEFVVQQFVSFWKSSQHTSGARHSGPTAIPLLARPDGVSPFSPAAAGGPAYRPLYPVAPARPQANSGLKGVWIILGSLAALFGVVIVVPLVLAVAMVFVAANRRPPPPPPRPLHVPMPGDPFPDFAQLPPGPQLPRIPGPDFPVPDFPNAENFARLERVARDPATSGLPPGSALSPMVGGTGGGDNVLVDPAGRLPVGLAYLVDENWDRRPTLKEVKPIYSRDERPVDWRGIPLSTVVAKDGYAIGGLVVDADQYVHALKVIFMHEAAGQLDSRDSYESDWLSTPTGNELVKLGGDGRAVLGLKTKQGIVLDGLGVVLRTKVASNDGTAIPANPFEPPQ
ncbi:MAG: hypothetical protein MUF06_00580 [Pirellulaceae bacterium]|nr:hypothetical protein [Pirellulaceae bacterium]